MHHIKSKDRELELGEFELFCKKIDKEIDDILFVLGWSHNSFDFEGHRYISCPFNSIHRLPETSLGLHSNICQWKAEGYNELDKPLSDSTLSPNSPSCIRIDEKLLMQILVTARQKDSASVSGMGDRLISRTSERIFVNFTCDERKIIYDYVIANTQKIEIGHDLSHLNNSELKEREALISYPDLLAQERNLKRRRVKHRGVHTNKKSRIEVMREVIEQQMKVFEEYLAQRHLDMHKKKLESSRHPKDLKITQDNQVYSYRHVNRYHRHESDRYAETGRKNLEIYKDQHSYARNVNNRLENSQKIHRHLKNEEQYEKKYKSKKASRSRSRSKERSRDGKKKHEDRHQKKLGDHRKFQYDDQQEKKNDRSRSKHRR